MDIYMHTCICLRAEIHVQDDYGISPCDLAETEEMMRAVGMFKSAVMLENTALFVLKVLYVCIFTSIHDCTCTCIYKCVYSAVRIFNLVVMLENTALLVLKVSYIYICMYAFMCICMCVRVCM